MLRSTGCSSIGPQFDFHYSHRLASVNTCRQNIHGHIYTHTDTDTHIYMKLIFELSELQEEAQDYEKIRGRAFQVGKSPRHQSRFITQEKEKGQLASVHA